MTWYVRTLGEQRVVGRDRGVGVRGGLLELRERGVGRCHDRERALAAERLDEAGLLHERNECREIPVARRDYHAVLGRGCGRLDRCCRSGCRERGGARHDGEQDCDTSFHLLPPMS